MIKIRQFVVLMVALTFFIGCASSKEGRLKEALSFPKLPDESKRLAVTYEFSSADHVWTEREHPEEIRQILEDRFVQVLRDSGYFTTIKKGAGSEGEGLHMKVRLTSTRSPSSIFPEIMTTITLFAIPSWTRVYLGVKANIATPNGREEAFQLTDSITVVRWFPLILITPFRNDENVATKRLMNIYKNLLIQMRDKQLFNP